MVRCSIKQSNGRFDRDLSLAGRVVVADKNNQQFTSKLIKIDRPIIRIPTLAIHLDRTINEAFKFNKETEFTPILGLASSELNAETEPTSDAVGTPVMQEKHSTVLLEAIAEEAGCSVGQIQDFELSLFDTQPATIGGLHEEFVYAPRCDNLYSSFCAIEGLCRAVEAEDKLKGGEATESNVRCVLLFDNEEVRVAVSRAHSRSEVSLIMEPSQTFSRGSLSAYAR